MFKKINLFHNRMPEFCRPADDIIVAFLYRGSLRMTRRNQLFLQCSYCLNSFLLKCLETGIKCLLLTEIFSRISVQ